MRRRVLVASLATVSLLSPVLTAVEGGEAAAQTTSGTDLVLTPAQIVFTAPEGGACDAPQHLGVTAADSVVDWQLTATDDWIQVSAHEGETPAQVVLTADCTDLPVGVHEAEVVVQGDGGEVTVPVTAVVNPAAPVRVATWRDGHRGAFSVSVDDGRDSGFTELTDNGLAGTFVMNGTSAPPSYPAMHDAGMELGSHLVSHYCDPVDEATLRYEIEANLAGVTAVTGDEDEVVSLVWPCGFTHLDAQAVASEYFMSARGYHINELEDPTPSNIMNLKSFNSHEHEPYPPADLRTIVDAAETSGKWANLVLHDFTNDDGAIAYATSKDVWTAPIGDVVKYILQRDRTVVADVAQTSTAVQFSVRRLPVETSRVRDLEATIGADDQLTLRVDLPAGRHASEVVVGGTAVPFRERDLGGSRVAEFSTAVTTTSRQVVVGLVETQPPRLHLSTGSVELRGTVGTDVLTHPVEVANHGGGTLEWSATVPDAAWLTVQPGTGTGPGTLTLSADTTGLPVGVHVGTVQVSAPGALDPVQSVTVRVRITPPDTHRLVFDYADRAALVGDGWSFAGRTPGGAARDTESPGAVTYTSSGLRLQAIEGDLWESVNTARNLVGRDLPEDWSTVEVALDFAPWGNYQQAGLLLYGSDNDYLQVTRNYNSWTGGQQVSMIGEVSGKAGEQRVASTATSVRLRMQRTGEQVVGSFSTDGGLSWVQVGTRALTVDDPRLVIFVGGHHPGDAGPGTPPTATVREALVVAGYEEPAPEPDPEPDPRPGTFVFDYADRAALVGDGWGFRGRTAGGAVRETESPGAVTYTSSGLRLQAIEGDLWESVNTARNLVGRDLPEDWSTVEVALDFAPLGNYQQAGLMLYEDDDNYVQVTRNYNSWTGGQQVSMIGEVSGHATEQRVASTATGVRLRMQRVGSQVVGSFSTDGGTSWVHVGTLGLTVDDPRLVIFVGGHDVGGPGTPPTATVREALVVPGYEEPAPEPEPDPRPGTFVFDYPNRTALMTDGWGFRGRTAGGAVRETESPGAVTYTSSGLRLQAIEGDLWESVNTARNLVGRDLPEDWSRVEVELDFAPWGNYQQAGLLLYGNDDSYVQVTRNYNSWTGGQQVSMIGEVSGHATEQRVASTATSVRLRMQRSGAQVVGSFSTDGGTSWVQVGTHGLTVDDPRLVIFVGGNHPGDGGPGTPPTATVREVVVVGGA